MRKNFVISKSSLQNIAIFFAILMTVLLSKTYYFGVVNRSVYQYVFYFGVLFGGMIVGLKIKKLKKAITAVLPLLIFLCVNILLNLRDMSGSNINQVVGVMLSFICAGLAASYISIKNFSACYIRIVSVICAVSIPCFFIALLDPNLARRLCQKGYDWTVSVGYSPYYTWGWNGTIFRRNSGMFWEPGAFQGFILIAFLMLLFECDEKEIRHRKSVFLLYVITLLTTQSTTGYILFAIVLLTQWERIQNIFGDISVNLRYLFAMLIVVCSIYFVFSSGNISNKLLIDSSGSTETRFSDLLGGVMMVIKGGLFGLGETSIRNTYRIIYGVSGNDSVGLLSMAYTYGAIFAVYYIGLMIKGIQRFFRAKKTDMVIITVIFVILHLTENLWSLPVYIIIPAIGIVWTAQKRLSDI